MGLEDFEKELAQGKKKEDKKRDRSRSRDRHHRKVRAATSTPQLRGRVLTPARTRIAIIAISITPRATTATTTATTATTDTGASARDTTERLQRRGRKGNDAKETKTMTALAEDIKIDAAGPPQAKTRTASHGNGSRDTTKKTNPRTTTRRNRRTMRRLTMVFWTSNSRMRPTPTSSATTG